MTNMSVHPSPDAGAGLRSPSPRWRRRSRSYPLTNWLPGGHAAPWYPAILGEWISGSAIVVGVAVVLAILSRRVSVVWHDGALERPRHGPTGMPWSFGFALAFGALAIYATVASRVFSRVPISIDELVQLVQAKTFASGRLWRPASPTPEFFSVLNMVDSNGQVLRAVPAWWPRNAGVRRARWCSLAGRSGLRRAGRRGVLVVCARGGTATRGRRRGSGVVCDRAVRGLHVRVPHEPRPDAHVAHRRNGNDGARDDVVRAGRLGSHS